MVRWQRRILDARRRIDRAGKRGAIEYPPAKRDRHAVASAQFARGRPHARGVAGYGLRAVGWCSGNCDRAGHEVEVEVGEQVGDGYVVSGRCARLIADNDRVRHFIASVVCARRRGDVDGHGGLDDGHRDVIRHRAARVGERAAVDQHITGAGAGLVADAGRDENCNLVCSVAHVVGDVGDRAKRERCAISECVAIHAVNRRGGGADGEACRVGQICADALDSCRQNFERSRIGREREIRQHGVRSYTLRDRHRNAISDDFSNGRDVTVRCGNDGWAVVVAGRNQFLVDCGTIDRDRLASIVAIIAVEVIAGWNRVVRWQRRIVDGCRIRDRLADRDVRDDARVEADGDRVANAQFACGGADRTVTSRVAARNSCGRIAGG